MCKPLISYRGDYLISSVLKSRPWFEDNINHQFIFILRRHSQNSFLRKEITSKFPDCKFVEVDCLTKGALMSAVAGVSLIHNFDESLIVDLADIFFTSDLNPVALFEKDVNLNGIIPVFEVVDGFPREKFSYVTTDGLNVTQVKEKKIISNLASAGAYIYRNPSVFIKAVAGSINRCEVDSYEGSLYLAPSFNSLIDDSSNSVKYSIVQDIELVTWSKEI